MGSAEPVEHMLTTALYLLEGWLQGERPTYLLLQKNLGTAATILVRKARLNNQSLQVLGVMAMLYSYSGTPGRGEKSIQFWNSSKDVLFLV